MCLLICISVHIPKIWHGVATCVTFLTCLIILWPFSLVGSSSFSFWFLCFSVNKCVCHFSMASHLYFSLNFLNSWCSLQQSCVSRTPALTLPGLDGTPGTVSPRHVLSVFSRFSSLFCVFILRCLIQIHIFCKCIGWGRSLVSFLPPYMLIIEALSLPYWPTRSLISLCCFHKHMVLYRDTPCSLISLFCLHWCHMVCSPFLTHSLNFHRSDVSWTLLPLFSSQRSFKNRSVTSLASLNDLTPVSVSWGHNLFLPLAANVVGWWRKWIQVTFPAPENRIEMIANLRFSRCCFPAFLPSGNTSKNDSIYRVCQVSGWAVLRSQPTGLGSGWPGPLADWRVRCL